MLTKQEIRKEIRQKRKELLPDVWQDMSHQICEKLRVQPIFREADVVYAYLAKTGEVLLDELIREALDQGKQVAVPKVLGERMVFFRIRSLEDVEIGCMGIREPVSGIYPQGKKPLLLMPLVAVDENLHRIGYGGGYYDRYLEQNRELPRVAVAFSFQVYPRVPAEAFDIGVEAVITEKAVLGTLPQGWTSSAE